MNDENSGTKRTSRAPADKPSDESSLFEKVVPDGIKRGLEGILRDGRLKNIVGDMKLPKEIVNHIISQVDDTKQAAIGVISREVRLFLENTNLSEELAKLLTQISFEVSTQVRFVPSDKAIKRDKKSKDNEETLTRSSSPPPPTAEEDSEKES
ncbi:MAG: hypothetical protein GY854_16315 [Deltaproteobacteria bacterium]|nr:hypothetical protein [Deltaproteobacteria bacterium]